MALEQETPVQLPSLALDLIFGHLSVSQRARMSLVSKGWNAALRDSRSLWTCTKIFLDRLDQDSVPHLAQWLSNRAEGVRELELHFSEPCWWGSIAYLLGIVGKNLQRLELCGIDCADDNLHWLAGLSAEALRVLHLNDCLGQFHPGLTRLIGLQELVVSHASDSAVSYSVPNDLSRLTNLSRLELRHGVAALPRHLSALTGLRLLTLEGIKMRGDAEALNAQLSALTKLEELGLDNCGLADVPPALGVLLGLTCLALPGCFDGQSWGRSTWEAKLQVLSTLVELQYLDLSDNNIPQVPRHVAHLPKLRTLKVGLNCLDQGLAEGPYPALEHLDLHGSSISDLPDSLLGAQQLTFLGLSCCHSLELDRQLVERMLGKLQGLSQITLCGSMLESVDSAKALLTLGRMLPAVEILSQDEIEDQDGEHHHDVADPHGNEYTSSDDDLTDYESSEEDGSEDDEGGDTDGEDSEASSDDDYY